MQLDNRQTYVQQSWAIKYFNSVNILSKYLNKAALYTTSL